MDLSILIPARNEMFLARTIQDILDNIEAETEIIAVCDGNWPAPAVADHPRVTLIYHSQAIGQRAATNEAARLSQAEYVMKCDAHCAFDQGFDAKLIREMQPDWTMIPAQYNLHAFDWQCKKCGKRTYQGPQPAACECGHDEHEMMMVWQPRWNRLTTAWRFDQNLHFQYWGEFSRRPAGKAEISDTMSCLGACWLMERRRYWELGGLDEAHGSWGQMGTELACKSWLSGGRMVTNKKTWYAHMFRTQPGFGFPYPLSGSQVEQARAHSRRLWKEGQWPGAKYPLSWLLERFKPVPGWPETAGPGLTKGIVYYTDNRLDERIMTACQRQIERSRNGYELVSVSLRPVEFGENIVVEAERGILTMFRQILAGLEASRAEIIFLCEHDVLYHPSHFDFKPPRRDVVYYNENVWKVDYETGRALYYRCRQTSGLCADRELLVKHYRQRVAMVERDGFSRKMGFEPGTHRRRERVDDLTAESWMSERPNIDIRHRQNLTPSRWRQDQFRDKRNCQGWIEADNVPGWGTTLNRLQEMLDENVFAR